MRQCHANLVVAAVVLAASPACTDDRAVFGPATKAATSQTCLGGATSGCAAALQVQIVGEAAPVLAWQTRKITAAAGDTLQPLTATVRLTNTATGPTAHALRLLHVEVTSPDAGQPWLCVAGGSETACEDHAAKWPLLVPAGLTHKVGGSVPVVQFAVRLSPKVASGHKAKVCVVAEGDPTLQDAALCFWIAQAPSPPKIVIEPGSLSFNGFATKTESQPLTVRNQGGLPLLIHTIALHLPSHYTLADNQFIAGGGGNRTFDPPVAVMPGQAWHLSLARQAGNWSDAGGTVRFSTNDPHAPSPVKVDVVATLDQLCLFVQPGTHVDFGTSVPGTAEKNAVLLLKNCGSAAMTLTGVQVVQDSKGSGKFAVDWAKSEGAAGSSGIGPTPAAPVVLPAGGSASLTVTYTASALYPPDHTGKLLIAAGGEVHTVTLTAQNVAVTCPIAKVTVVEGEQVVPQTVIHLKGDKSTVPTGSVKKYNWTVKQPAGSNQPLMPNASFANPTLTANTSGEYEFCLEVWDANDSKSCSPECIKVLVIPNNALHVELSWNTPADADQTDNGLAAGADLDLHFAHPMAQTDDQDCDGKPDPWFSNPWDTFWYNASPNWGSSGNTKDDPTLDLDDTDGAGPENLNLIDPEGTADSPAAYAVGAHYWNDHGFGTSYVTVSIWMQGGLAVQVAGVAMQPLDMWYVGKVHWPNVVTGGSKPLFESCLQSGLSCPAGKSLMWEPKGVPCITPCYKSPLSGVGGSASSSACQPWGP